MIDGISQRDIFETQYICVFFQFVPYCEAKKHMESNRFHLSYSDNHMARHYENWVRGDGFDKDSVESD